MSGIAYFDNWIGLTSGIKRETIIQVVSASTSTEISTTSLSYVNTNLAVTITPQSASSTILVIVNDIIRSAGAAAYWEQYSGYGIFRDGLATALSEAIYGYGYGKPSGASGKSQTTGVYQCAYDSPNTTSAVTYRTKFLADIDGGSQTAYAHSTAGFYVGTPTWTTPKFQITAFEIST